MKEECTWRAIICHIINKCWRSGIVGFHDKLAGSYMEQPCGQMMIAAQGSMCMMNVFRS